MTRTLSGPRCVTPAHSQSLGCSNSLTEGLVDDFKNVERAHCPACGSAFELEVGETVEATSPCPECQTTGLRIEPGPGYTGDAAHTRLHLEQVIRSGQHLLNVVGVYDQGIGIPADEQGKLFQAFTQVGSGENRRFGGTGLGLAISKMLVEAHHGQIWFESKVDHGSRFYVRLPLSRDTLRVVGPNDAPPLSPRAA